MKVIQIQEVWKKYRLHYEKQIFVKEIFSNLLRRNNYYEEFWALCGVSIDVEKGETVAIIGRNGSGKTTILKLLSGITKSSKGSIDIKGKVVGLLELGAGFQVDLTGRENVYLNGSILGLTKREIKQRIDSIVDFAEIGDFIDARVRTYSSGMCLRLGFAIAAHVKPDILLIDEVLSVGDTSFQEKCFDRILQFKKENKTIIFVSHNLEIIKKLCDRVVFLEKGKILKQGFPEEVVESYLIFLDREFKRKNMKATNTNWPTNGANIKNVVFKNRHGEVKKNFDIGEQMVVRIEYSAQKRIYQPVFGIGVYLKDIYLVGPNTRDHNFKIDYIEGDGAIEFKMRIPFASGRYKVSASIHNLKETYCYDYFDRIFEFEVKPGDKDVKYGLFDIRGEWSIV